MASFSYTTDTSINFFRLFSSTDQLLEKFSYGYNEFSDTYLEVFDFGGLQDEATEFDDFGSLASTAMEFDVYGSITQTSTFANGSVGKIISSTKYSFTRASEIQGITFLFQGKSNVYINKSHIGYGIVSDINGILIEKNTESYVGTGRAFGFGSKAERVVSSYNNSSVVSFISVDYNSITLPEDSFEDYGSILDESNLPSERDDYGLITGRGLRPYGLTKLISTTTEKNTEDYVGTGSLFNFGNVKVFVLPIHIGSGSIRVRGSVSDLKNTESYVGTGRVFGFGSKAESTAVSYNESSIVDFESIDYNSITLPEDSFEDYGSINDTEFYGPQTDDYGLITGRGLRPYGLTRFSSGVIEKNTEDYVGTGIAFGFGNVQVFVLPIHIGSGSIRIRGAASDLKNTESYVGSGSLFTFSSATESFGQKPPVSGLFRVSGSAVEKNTENYVGTGIAFGFVNALESITEPYVGSGSIRVRGSVSDLKNTESYVGTGRAFGFGSKAESTAVSYNESSVVDFESIDYNLITLPEDSFEDYGSILDESNLPSERDDYGLITGRGLRPYGLTKFSGSVVEKNTEDYVGTGSLFNFGNVKVFVLPIHIGSGSFSITGAVSNLKNTESYVGTGRAFGFGSKAESTAVSYNESSVVDFDGLDYGLITLPEDSFEDYGSINDTEFYGPQTDDYGLITGRGLRPYGLTKFSGSVVEKNTEDYVGTGIAFGFGNVKVFVLPSHIGSGSIRVRGAISNLKNTESYVGSGSLFTFSSTTEAFGQKPPVSGLFRVSGTAVEKNTESYVGTGIAFGFVDALESTTEPYVGSGSFSITGAISNLKNTESYVGTGRAFGFGSKAESTAVSYNESSIVDFGSLDYGLINDIENSTEDYGSIIDNELYGQQTDDYGLITGRGLRPYGLTRFSSGVIEKNTENYVGTGIAFGFVNALESITEPYVGSGSIRVRGAISNLKNTESYVGSGSLFTFSSTTEAFGPKPPSSGLFRISGTAEPIIITLSYVGSGLLFNFGNAREFVLPSYTGSGSFSITGAVSNLKNTESYVGTGRAFGFGSKAESTAVSYNESSVVDFDGLDYGLINDIENSTEDYGSILDESNLPSERDDYGLITGRGLRPYGLTRFSSRVIEKNTESYVGTGIAFGFVDGLESTTEPYVGSGSIGIRGAISNLKNTESYVGSGSLFTFSSTTEAFGPKPPSSGLFRVSGAAVEKNTESYVGTGIAFGFVDGLESTTEPYVGSGSFSITGAISNLKNTESYVGSGSLFTFVSATESFSPKPPSSGLFRVSGTGEPIIITLSYVGSGSLFAFSSTTEAFGSNPPESTTLFRISGSSTQSITPTTEIGSGSLFTFSSATEAFGPKPPSSGLFRVSGTAEPIIINFSYNGSGSLFAFSSTTEAFGPKPPVSGLFRIFGSSTQSITPTTEIGSGSVFVRQSSQILDAENKGRLVAAFESTGITEIAIPQAIKLSGRVGIYFQFREEGFGTLKVRGRALITLKPIHIGGGSYFIRGSANESITPVTEIGSGSLFTFASSSESIGANPPENTALFKIGGFSSQRHTESYVGIGIEKINGESLILIRQRYFGSGSISITAESKDSRNYSFSGSGKLFGFGSASEYLTNAYKLDNLVIRIRGSAEEVHSESYIGSGSIFTFISASESKGSNPPENIALFKFTGSGSSRTQPQYDGGGKLNISEGQGRPDKNNKTFIISSDESSSIRTIEKPVIIKTLGSARTSKPTVYKGKGRLFGFGGASESTSFSPDDTKVLFNISGTGNEKNTEAYRGSGTAFSIIGSSYSETSIVKGQTSLFKVTGSVLESFSEGNYIGSGKIVTSVQSRAIVSFSPKLITKLFAFNGNAQERNTEAFNGSGTIGAFISSGRSVFYDYTVSQKVLRIFGNTFESFGKSNYNGEVNTAFVGASKDRENKYVSPKRSRVIII